ncbi:uncharacterized protein F4807DRAFT_239082 [Annulohypoxylon truncatum]|uniref:uncharacterized protein n=1 Tax=Annulohypoxylon truncatum TaxID=327061 RepID=UPI002007425F|nr:uncharacterized protein F4807DRAFT_239082 [Annulohypoxylon truncatum]KAI1206143.1 hypothetical protein F4807DRAFT_239082 [Annulohypoxylon truncatum]
MGSPLYRRRARANDLRIVVREDVPKIPEDPDLSGSGGDGGPDSPSPISPSFPSPLIGSSTPSQQPTVTSSKQIPSPTETSSAQIPSATTSSASSRRTKLSSSTSTSVPVIPASSFSASITQNAEAQNTDVTQAQVSQQGASAPGLGTGGTIAFGTIGIVVIIAALGVFIWRCRRRHNRESRGLLPESMTASGYEKMEEPRRPITADYASSRGAPSRNTPSRMMDNLMRAAYAAEDGSSSQYSVYVDGRRQSSGSAYPPDPRQPMSMRQSSASMPQPRDGSATNSVYVNQLLSGYYHGQREDGLTVPPNARMPPPAAPSIAGQTEVTATSESTWRTWGWSQPKPQVTKEGWIDKCVRLGGLR